MALTDNQRTRLPAVLIKLCQRFPDDARPIMQAILGTLSAGQEQALFDALKALAQEKHAEATADAQHDIDTATGELLDPFDP
jgi:hypothetical protein